VRSLRRVYVDAALVHRIVRVAAGYVAATTLLSPAEIRASNAPVQLMGVVDGRHAGREVGEVVVAEDDCPAPAATIRVS